MNQIGGTMGANQRERVEKAFGEIGIGGIYDVFDADDPTDAIRQLGLYIREAEEELPGGFMPDEDSQFYGESLAGRIHCLVTELQELRAASLEGEEVGEPEAWICEFRDPDDDFGWWEDDLVRSEVEANRYLRRAPRGIEARVVALVRRPARTTPPDSESES